MAPGSPSDAPSALHARRQHDDQFLADSRLHMAPCRINVTGKIDVRSWRAPDNHADIETVTEPEAEVA